MADRLQIARALRGRFQLLGLKLRLQCFQIIVSPVISRLRRRQNPSVRGSGILAHATAGHIQEPQLDARAGVSLFSRFLEPLCC